MAVSTGSVSVDVVPDASGWISDLSGQILGDSSALGERLGREIGKAAARAIADEIRDGIDDGVDRSRPEGSAGRKGRESGARFAREFKAQIEEALRNLPEVNLDVDDSELNDAEREIKKIREELTSLKGKKIGVDIGGADALKDIEKIRARIETLRNTSVDIDVNYDTDSAAAALETLQRDLVNQLSRNNGQFRDSLRNEITSAFTNLPDIQLDADSSLAERKIAKLRAEMEALSDNVALGMDDGEALTKLEAIRAKLVALSNQHISVELDADIDASLARVRAALETAGARDGDAFGANFKRALQAATANLPKINVDADTSQSALAIENIRKQLNSLGDKRIGVDIDAADAIAKVEGLQALLESIARNSTDVELKLDADAASAELQAFVDRVGEAGSRGGGAFSDNLKNKLREAAATLPDISPDVNSAPALAKVAELKAGLSNLSARITADADIGLAMGQLATLKALAESIDKSTVDINVKADVASAIAQLKALQGAASAAADAGGASFGRMQLILIAVIALFPVIAGAIVALAGAFALVVTPIAAIALGLNGIQQAAAPLYPLFAQLKTAVSDVFAGSLGPAIQGIVALMPTLQAGLVGAAQAVSGMANEVVRVSTSGANLHIIGDSFNLINTIIGQLTPGLTSLSENIIRLTNIGAQGMQLFGTQLQAVGTAWRLVIDSLQSTGAGVASVQALFTIFTSLLNLLAPLTELGARILAAFGPVLSGAFDALAVVIGALNNVLSLMSTPVLAVVAAMGTFIAVLAVLGVTLPSVSLMATGLGVAFLSIPAFVTAAATAIRGFVAALATLLLNPITLAVGALALVLSTLASEQAAASAAASAHAANVSGLAGELQRTNGVVTEGTRAYIAQTETFHTAAAGATDLGIGLGTVTDAATGNQGALETLRQKLSDNVVANRTWLASIFGSTDALGLSTLALNEQGEKSQAALIAVNELAATYTDAAARNRELAEALRTGNQSTVAGVASATALRDAIKTLGEAASTTADKATALVAALTVLAGGTVPLEVAVSNMRAAMTDLGKNMEAARVASVGLGQGLIDSTGGLNTNTTAGQAALAQTLKLRDGMAQAATAAFDHAGGMRNVAVASDAARSKAEEARAAFINAVDPLHQNAAAAGELADRYGLIPSLVVTLLQAQGIPQVSQDLQEVQGLLRGLPNNVPINVGVISGQAEQILRDIGFQVTHMEDGTVTITATDKTRDTLDGAVNTIRNTPGEMPIQGVPQVAPGIGQAQGQVAGAQAPMPIVGAPALSPAIAAAQGQVAGAQAPMPITGAPALSPAIAAAQGQVAGSPPAQLPITGDASQVPPAAQAAAGQVASIPAVLTIEPGGLAYVQTAIMNIRSSISTPTNFSVGVSDNATPVIDRLHAAVAAPALMPVGITDNTAGAIGGIRAAASVPATMPISIADNASGAIGGLHAAASAPATMPIDANTGGADGQLSGLVGRVTGTTATMQINANSAGADGQLSAAVARVNGTTAIMQIDANWSRAGDQLGQAINRVTGTTAIMQIDANTSAAMSKYDALAQPRTTTLTVNIVTNGALPVPNAIGNIIPAGFKAFAAGGMHTMAAGRAAIVGPNSPRVIGDRAHDDEAYIPINNSPRSKALLNITAGRMGYGLMPMARGGLVAGLDNTVSSVLRLAQAMDGGSVSTQQTSSFISPSDSPSRNGGLSNNETVEQKLDQVVAALKEIRPGPGSITVEDRSGNPVETARATQLALRLAR